MLACVLRPSDRDPAKILSALVRTLARRLRQAWPQVKLIMRAPCAASDHWGIDYVIGLAKNAAQLRCVALAYTLMVHLRRHAQQGTQLARAWVIPPKTQTIRTGLLKIGAAIIRNTRRVRVLLASNHPLKAVFLIAAQRLGVGGGASWGAPKTPHSPN